MTAVEKAAPAHVLSAALYMQFRSRQEHMLAEKVLSHAA
jgi:6-phosphogluconate dehydrogenase (decarboxylating)